METIRLLKGFPDGQELLEMLGSSSKGQEHTQPAPARCHHLPAPTCTDSDYLVGARHARPGGFADEEKYAGLNAFLATDRKPRVTLCDIENAIWAAVLRVQLEPGK